MRLLIANVSDKAEQNLCMGTDSLCERESGWFFNHPWIGTLSKYHWYYQKMVIGKMVLKIICWRSTFGLSFLYCINVRFIQMDITVPEVIKEEFRKNIADGNEIYNDKWVNYNSVKQLTFPFWQSVAGMPWGEPWWRGKPGSGHLLSGHRLPNELLPLPQPGLLPFWGHF